MSSKLTKQIQIKSQTLVNYKCSVGHCKNNQNIVSHPLLNVPICSECLEKYNLGEFTIENRDGKDYETFCRWCGDGGRLFFCDSCPKAFCFACLNCNFSNAEMQRIKNVSNRWKCLVCIPQPLDDLFEKNNWQPLITSKKRKHSMEIESEGITLVYPTESDKTKTFFLKEWVKELNPLSHTMTIVKDHPKEILTFNGDKYSLATSKFVDCYSTSTPMRNIRNESRLSSVYVRTETNGKKLLELEKVLETLADFKSLLSPRKIATRIGMLQKCVNKKDVKELKFDQFMMIDEVQPSEESGGCGFIPKDLLMHLMGNTKVGSRITSIQVRIISPKLGIFKGMLTIKENIDKIQLTPSMRKVGPSTVDSQFSDRVWLLIVNSSPSVNNLSMGTWINGGTPPKSFKQNKLSDMILNLFEMVGVPNKVITKYKTNRLEQISNSNSQRKFRKECWPVGIADPTDSIPDGFVYITGLSAEHIPKGGVFVTRAPCILPSDGRCVPVLTARPKKMSSSDWESLGKRTMGEIIFHNKKSSSNDKIGLPQMISGGDLDGDLYYVCWDSDIVDNVDIMRQAVMKNDSIANTNKPKCSSKIINSKYDNTNWLLAAQEHMISSDRIDDKRNVGILYKEMGKIFKSSPDSFHDKDYQLLGAAYKQSIDGQKHGGKIELPEYLKEKLKIH